MPGLEQRNSFDESIFFISKSQELEALKLYRWNNPLNKVHRFLLPKDK